MQLLQVKQVPGTMVSLYSLKLKNGSFILTPRKISFWSFKLAFSCILPKSRSFSEKPYPVLQASHYPGI